MDREIGVGGFAATPLARRYVNEVLDSGRLSYGPFHRRFETAFAKEHDSGHAVFCNSGTSALQIALQALKEKHGWKDGDEVIVPAVTFIATSNIVLHNRMTPVFVDVDPLTYTMDPAKLAAAITKKTRAVIPVHLLGLPADMDPLGAVARGAGLSIIEDSAETMFARYKGRKVGSLGDIGCFSTYIAHYIVTGAGGLSTTSDPDLHVRMRSLMNHGRDSIYLNIDDDKDASGARLHEIVAKRFQFVSVGHSYRATELEAALGLAQLEEKDAIYAARTSMAARLIAGLAEFEDRLQLPRGRDGCDHSYMLFGLVLKGEDKTPLVNFLEDKGVETRDMLPLLNQPVYKKLFGDLEPKFPVARGLNRSAFYIGCHQYMTAADADYVVEQFRAFFRTR
ncbi:MAG: DegT/DnrJ/EryC1/StrS family aminotransferase [Elusimicrobiota bacterium]|nr:MAG: DegT/DnrJ/EryC1/StrS family aminotransferase [Elusimicrobiota bacterium]